MAANRGLQVGPQKQEDQLEEVRFFEVYVSTQTPEDSIRSSFFNDRDDATAYAIELARSASSPVNLRELSVHVGGKLNPLLRVVQDGLTINGGEWEDR